MRQELFVTIDSFNLSAVDYDNSIGKLPNYDETYRSFSGLLKLNDKGLDGANALDKKTEELAYLAVLAALRLESGMPFHVQSAKQAGASKEEIISAILIGLPAAGNAVIQVLPTALNAFENEPNNG